MSNSNVKILVVDDVAENRDLLVRRPARPMLSLELPPGRRQ